MTVSLHDHCTCHERINGGSSLIRKMFEEGKRLKKIYVEDKVFDFIFLSYFDTYEATGLI